MSDLVCAINQINFNCDCRIPLAARFNRDVYIEGIKHRLDNDMAESTSACTIQ